MQLANLHEYTFFYMALAKMLKTSSETSSSSILSPLASFSNECFVEHNFHPAMRAWLGLPDRIGQQPAVFTESSILDVLFGPRGNRSELIDVCLAPKKH